MSTEQQQQQQQHLTPARAVLRPLVHSRLLEGCRGLVSIPHGLAHRDVRLAHGCRPRCKKPEIKGSIARNAFDISNAIGSGNKKKQYVV